MIHEVFWNSDPGAESRQSNQSPAPIHCPMVSINTELLLCELGQQPDMKRGNQCPTRTFESTRFHHNSVGHHAFVLLI